MKTFSPITSKSNSDSIKRKLRKDKIIIQEDNDRSLCNDIDNSRKIRISQSFSNFNKNKETIYKKPDAEGVDLISKKMNVVNDLVEKGVNLLNNGNIYRIKNSNVDTHNYFSNNIPYNMINNEIYHKKSKFFHPIENLKLSHSSSCIKNNPNSDLKLTHQFNNIRHYNNINANNDNIYQNYNSNHDYYKGIYNYNMNMESSKNFNNINDTQYFTESKVLLKPNQTDLDNNLKKKICINDDNQKLLLDHDSSRYILNKFFNENNSNNNKGGIVDLNIYNIKNYQNIDEHKENSNDLKLTTNEVFTLDKRNDSFYNSLDSHSKDNFNRDFIGIDKKLKIESKYYFNQKMIFYLQILY